MVECYSNFRMGGSHSKFEGQVQIVNFRGSILGWLKGGFNHPDTSMKSPYCYLSIWGKEGLNLPSAQVFWIFGGHKSFSWRHSYPCFGLLVTSALAFKARVNPLHAFSLVRTRLLRLKRIFMKLPLYAPKQVFVVALRTHSHMTSTASQIEAQGENEVGQYAAVTHYRKDCTTCAE